MPRNRKGETLLKVFNKRFVQATAALGVVATLALVTPRAAHAVAAALVQVSNTTENPAITQDTSKRAGQMIQLICETSANNVSSCGEGTISSTQPSPYTVPTPLNLIITSVELNGYGGYTGNNGLELLDTTQGMAYHQWTFSGPSTSQFQYPSGIVLPSGTMPSVFSPSGAVAQITGYLSNN
jgi:hypothetical protein